VTTVTDFRAVSSHNRSMMTLTQNRTVGEIAAEVPASMRIFEKYGIDFCCGGKIAVAEACVRAKVDASSLLAEIDEAAQGPAGEATDWSAAPLGALIEHIVETHHVYLKTQLPRLEAMLEKVTRGYVQHGETLRAIAGVFAPMKAELLGHLIKEEMVLFPLIRGLVAGEGGSFHCGSVQNPIRVMCFEHDSAGEGLARLRHITSGFAAPSDACNTFRALYHELEDLERDLHRHIHLENNILFPRAIELEAA
jgi:regulator of cell morphogenesis and NO signaling